MRYQVVLAIAASIMLLVSYIPYIRNMLSGHTKPHAFSWFVWGSLSGTGFIIQLLEGGGAGSWVVGATSIACFTIFGMALRGDRSYTRLDWLSLGGAGLSWLMWWLTSEALVAVLFLILTDLFGLVPTLRKSYVQPYSETATTYALNATAYFISLLALSDISLVTALYPAALALFDGVTTALLLVRRRSVDAPKGRLRKPPM